MNGSFKQLGASTLGVVGVLALVAAMGAPSATPTRALAAQGIDISAPKRAAQRAVAAQDAQLSAQTGRAVPSRTVSTAPISGPGSNVSQAGQPAESPAPAGAIAAPAAGSRL